MKTLFNNLFLILIAVTINFQNLSGQTSNPAVQSLPYTQNFGTSTFTVMPTGWVAWNGLSGASINSQSSAEASSPTGNATVTAATSAQTGGGVYGFASSSNGRPYIQTSSNTTNGANQIATAIITTGLQNINVSYDIEIISAQPRTIGMVMQYRNGTSGSWTTVSGTNNPFSQAGGTTGVKSTVTVTLPAAAENQTGVQLRWAVWRGSETGNSSGIAIDNISISGTAMATPTISLAGTLTPQTTIYPTSSSTSSFNLTGTDMTNSIVVGPLNGFEFADNSVGTYFSTLTLANATSVSKTIDVRLASNIAAGSYSGNIPVSSTGATSQSITAGMWAVNQKNLTITGISANNKVFDGNTTATLSGSANLIGVEIGDIPNVALGGTPVATFVSSAVGTGIPVNVSGYTISGSASNNYSLSQPSSLSADITASSLTLQTITFNSLPAATYGDAAITLNASGGGSGNPITYISSNTNVATISGNTLTIVGAGSTLITANQAGDGITYDDAIPVSQTQVVNVKGLTINGGSANNKVYDGTTVASINQGTLVGVVGSDDVSLIGMLGTFANANVGNGINVTTNHTLGGTTSLNYALTQSSYTADITQASQTITFGTLATKIFGDADFSLSATGGASGNAITFASDNSLVATVSGNTVTIVGAGSANITASQAGNTNYSAASDAIKLLTVNKANQFISFAALANKTTDDAPFILNATGGASGNLITFASDNPLVANVSGSTVTIVGVGTANITASQAGNDNYNAANNVVRALNVTCPVLAGWDVSASTNYGVTPLSPSITNSNITSGGLIRSSGVVTGSGAAARAWGGTTWSTTNAQDGIAANKYIIWTVKGNTGYSTNMCTLSPLDYRRSSTGPAAGLLQYSTNGTSFTDITTLNFSSSASSGASIGPIDLSSINSLQNIHSSTLVTFRLIPYAASGTGSFYIFDVLNSAANDLAVTGNTTNCSPSSSTANVTICDNQLPYNWNAQSLTTAGTYTATFINSLGCDSTANLVLSVNATSSSVSTISACDTYTWPINNQIYTISGSYVHTLINVNNCLHTDTLHLTITTSVVCQNGGTNNINCGCNCPSGFIGVACETAVCNTTFGASSLTACNSYNWNSNTYTSGGSYSGTFVNAGGCDSIHTLILTINNSTSISTTQTACDAYTWPANNQTYTVSNTYTHTSLNANNCLHTDTLHLIINVNTASTSSATACDSYVWMSNTYTATGMYSGTSSNAAGCVHTDNLNLTINHSTSSSSAATNCDSYTWAANGQSYTSSGTYSHTSLNANNCVHYDTLYLILNYSTSATSSETACDSYTWPANGMTYTASGTYSITTPAAIFTCPHTQILNLTINNSTTSTSSATGCDSYTWSENNAMYTSSGIYTHTSLNGNNCLHTATLNLTINNSTATSSAATNCDSYTWSANGQTYTSSGTYTHTSLNANSCIHYDTLYLILNYSTSATSSATACNSYTWPANGMTYTASGTYSITTPAAIFSCPHTQILNLTINNSTASTSSATGCDSYTWSENNATYTSSGIYTHTSLNGSNCLHTATLNLTINNSTTSTSGATSCDSYTWTVNNANYTTSGIYTSTSLNAAGCLHTEILNLVINNSSAASQTATACDSYVWSYNNATYTASGAYAVTSTNALGCTHTETLNLTITTSSTSTSSTTSCGSYTWSVNNVTYTTSGTYTATVGCVTYILNVTIQSNNTFNYFASSNGCYTWSVNGATYSASGSYTFTTTNVGTGCLETHQLNLSVSAGVKFTGNVLLAGPYDSNTGLMHDSIRAILPTTEPYTTAPYGFAAIACASGETTTSSVLTVTGSNAIVDWIYLELRDASNSNIIVATKRALLQRDGDIVSHLDGTSPVFFDGIATGSYWVSVKHRNHLGVMTQATIALGNCGTTSVLFSNNPVYVKPGVVNGPRKTVGTVYPLWSADCNNNKNVKYNGLSNDKDKVLNAVGGPSMPNNAVTGYRMEDGNLDGIVRYNGLDNDRVIILSNVGVNTPNNILYQHTPN